ncbi:MAG: Crp/Fnr family transcriptional regulator [Saprospiraceae bacterium]|nr:Crp/Fnr family transcriptional regulator [Saprospiraceae bacterium]
MDNRLKLALHDALNAFGLQSSEAKNLFYESGVLRIYPRNAVLFYENAPNELEYLLVEGVLHRYNTDQDGKDITTGFYAGNAIVTPHFSRTVGGRSIFALQALTDIAVAEIPVKVLDQLRYTHPEYRTFGQRVIEAEFSRNLINDIAFRSGTAAYRLELFRKIFPGLENIVPHYHIATYIGVTNVSFSRLRRKK